MTKSTVSFVIFSTLIFTQILFAQKQIIINELSQGPNDDWEWIEYLILEDSTDIRGVYLDDNDLVHGTLGSAKLVQLKTDLPAFENVSKGALIVIYKSTDSTYLNSQDPKLYAAGIPDTDFSDNVILIPHTNTEFLEAGSWWPRFRSEGENLGIFEDSGLGIFGMSYGNESPEGDFTNGWGMVNLIDIPYHGAGFYTGQLASTAFDSTLWGIGYSSLGTPGSYNLGQGDIPVEFVSFGASDLNGKVLLKWITATELNNQGFDVERSLNKLRWDKIGFVQGNGSTTETMHYQFVDNEIGGDATYYYRLKQVDYNGAYSYSEIIEVNIGAVKIFELHQNYPNPFNPSTNISFSLVEGDYVTLKVYNSLSEEIFSIQDGYLEAGNYNYHFNAQEYSSGILFYKLTAGEKTQVRKMMLMK